MARTVELVSNWRQAVYAWRSEQQGVMDNHPSYRHMRELATKPMLGDTTVFIPFDPHINAQDMRDWLSDGHMLCVVHRCFRMHQYNISDYRTLAGLHFRFSGVAHAVHFKLFWFRPILCRMPPPARTPEPPPAQPPPRAEPLSQSLH